MVDYFDNIRSFIISRVTIIIIFRFLRFEISTVYFNNMVSLSDSPSKSVLSVSPICSCCSKALAVIVDVHCARVSPFADVSFSTSLEEELWEQVDWRVDWWAVDLVVLEFSMLLVDQVDPVEGWIVFDVPVGLGSWSESDGGVGPSDASSCSLAFLALRAALDSVAHLFFAHSPMGQKRETKK